MLTFEVLVRQIIEGHILRKASQRELAESGESTPEHEATARALGIEQTLLVVDRGITPEDLQICGSPESQNDVRTGGEIIQVLACFRGRRLKRIGLNLAERVLKNPCEPFRNQPENDHTICGAVPFAIDRLV